MAFGVRNLVMMTSLGASVCFSPNLHPLRRCAWAASKRYVSLPRARAPETAEQVRERTCVDLAPSHLVKSLLTWTGRKVASEHGTLPAPPPVPVIFHRDYGFDEWDPKHRFVMGKFHGVMRRIEQLELKPALRGKFRVLTDFEPISRDMLERVHDRDFVEGFCAGTLDAKALRKIGLPWSPQLVRRTLLECEGTRQTAILALEEGLACNTGGGTHHAFAGHGSGFTIFNDLAVTAQWLLDDGECGVGQVLVLDLDVHQGDGTASLFAANPKVHTVSYHCASNFPFVKQNSDLDVALPDGVGDKEYLVELSQRLPQLLIALQPDIVLFDAGVDVHQDDVLGKLNLTDAGLFDRDYYVMRVCAALDIPVATVVGGGYDANHELLAWRHSIVFQAAVAAKQHS